MSQARGAHSGSSPEGHRPEPTRGRSGGSTAALADRSMEFEKSPVRSRFRWLDQIRSSTAGRITLKVAVTVIGVAIVLLGVVMLPLPGPGWLVIFTGLAVLSIEFHWARRLLQFTRQKIRLWTQWVGRQSWLVRMSIGAAGMVLVAAVVAWIAVGNDTGAELVNRAWRFLMSLES